MQVRCMKLVFRVSPTQRLIIVETAVEQMLKFRQTRWWQPEAGGVLLGRHLLDSDDLVVDEVTTPQAADRRSRFGFFRSSQHSVLARRGWEMQGCKLAYLGLWHTHPQTVPHPSGVDRNDWSNAIANDTFEGNRLFFPIVGTERIRVWSKPRNGEIEELKEIGRVNGGRQE